MLTGLHDEFDENKHEIGRHEYPHFSAAALLIRCSFIIYFQREIFNWELMSKWEAASGIFLSKFVLKHDDYFTKKTQKPGIVQDIVYPPFPYIGNLLPSKALHEIYSNTTVPLSFHEMFEAMNNRIMGQMRTISDTSFNCSDNKESIANYVHLL